MIIIFILTYICIGILFWMICNIAGVFDKLPGDKRTQAGFAIVFVHPVVFVLSIPSIYKYLAGGIKALLNYKVWTEKE